ncbi:TetR family transcriptional regulator [Paenibacillus sp. FSL H8-0548]|uniref:TetR/AcrR family transcriptional regulator n=1 Tax=Paenibacillus sp. FSL H8-0548 TaxID=1920422 RepID=UPI00096C9E12|nr:TetR/AcrR family transcriptional regulator [Paenibacillus sp. FSL H8-0548]OMF22192.1 TetR family transcriptional regulator [Paenibacillus sp. FSL H8-0548]
MSPRRGLDLMVIVEAAAAIADEHGVQDVTLASLAQKLGVRSPSLYNHVNGLKGLRNQLAIYGLKKLTLMMNEVLENNTGDEAMHAVASAYISFARLHPGLYELTLRSPDDDDAEYVACAQQLVEMLINMLSHYKLDYDTSIHIVRGFRSLLHGFASIEQKGGFGMSQSPNDSIKIIVQTYINGLRFHPQ